MRIVLLILLLVLLNPILTFSQAQKWRSTNSDGKYPDTGLLDIWPESGLELVQTYTGIGEGFCSPSITEDGIYIAGSHDSIGYVYKFSHDGKKIWEKKCGEEFIFKYPGARSTATIDGNRVYYEGSMSDVYCLDSQNGEEIWHINLFEKYKGKSIKWGFAESPFIYNDKLIVTPGGPDVSVAALNKTDGSVIWEMTLEGDFNAYNTTYIINHNGQELGVLNLNKYLILFDPKTGVVKYKHVIFQDSGNHATSSLYSNGQILYTMGYGQGMTLFKLNDSTQGLDTLYFNADFDCKLSGLIQVGDLVYGTSDKRKLWVVMDKNTGETIFTSRDLKPGSFIMADDKFYIFTETGEVALARPNNKGFDILSRFKIPVEQVTLSFAFPVLYQGNLFIRYRDTIWRYNVKKE